MASSTGIVLLTGVVILIFVAVVLLSIVVTTQPNDYQGTVTPQPDDYLYSAIGAVPKVFKLDPAITTIADGPITYTFGPLTKKNAP